MGVYPWYSYNDCKLLILVDFYGGVYIKHGYRNVQFWPIILTVESFIYYLVVSDFCSRLRLATALPHILKRLHEQMLDQMTE